MLMRGRSFRMSHAKYPHTMISFCPLERAISLFFAVCLMLGSWVTLQDAVEELGPFVFRRSLKSLMVWNIKDSV